MYLGLTIFVKMCIIIIEHVRLDYISNHMPKYKFFTKNHAWVDTYWVEFQRIWIYLKCVDTREQWVDTFFNLSWRIHQLHINNFLLFVGTNRLIRSNLGLCNQIGLRFSLGDSRIKPIGFLLQYQMVDLKVFSQVFWTWIHLSEGFEEQGFL